MTSFVHIQAMFAGNVYSFYIAITNSFATLNPPIWQAFFSFEPLSIAGCFLCILPPCPDRPTISINGGSGQDMTSQWTGILRGVADGATALLIVLPSFTTLIGQTTFRPLNPNSISVTLSANIQLTVPPATAISLYGLTGTATASTSALPITQNAGSSTFLSTGYWDQASGTLILNVSQTLAQGMQVTATFAVQNGALPQLPPTVSIAAAGEVAFPAAAVTPTSVGDSQALYIVGFTVRAIAQSTPSASALNVISVSFAFNRRIPQTASISDAYSNPSITIAGLTNSQSASLTFLPDQRGFAFDSTWRTDGSAAPAWDQASGSLVLWPKQDIARLYVYTVNFQLTNPGLGQDARNVTISLGADFTFYMFDAVVRVQTIFGFSSQLMTNAAGIYAPLLVVDFLLSQIGQGGGTPSAGRPNTLTVTLTFRGAMVTTGVITISGMSNTAAAAGRRALADASGDSSCGQPSSCHLYFSSSAGGAAGAGNWTAGGTLVLYVVKPIPAGGTARFSFAVTNPAAGQFSPPISIQSNGLNAVVTPVAMGRDAGNAQPLAVAGFNSSSIQQSTQSEGALNTITVSLQPFTTLLAGATLTLSNMIGATLDPKIGIVLSLSPSCNLSCPFNVSDTPGGAHGKASWLLLDRTASFSFYLLSPLWAASPVSFSFQVRNPLYGQDAPAISVEGAGTDSIATRTLLPSPRGAYEAMRIAGFQSTYIYQSKAVAAFINNITVVFRAWNVFTAQPPSFLTITGLVGTFGTGEPSTVRSIYPAYSVSGGFVSAVLDSTTFVLNFSRSTDPSVAGNYSGQYLVIGGENSKMVGYNRTNATVTVQVATPISTAVSPLAQFQIATYPNYVFNSTGVWNMTSGQLLVPFIADTAADLNYSFFFQVKNPSLTQSGVTVSLSSSEIYIPTIQLTPGAVLLAPLYIGG